MFSEKPKAVEANAKSIEAPISHPPIKQERPTITDLFFMIEVFLGLQYHDLSSVANNKKKIKDPMLMKFGPLAIWKWFDFDCLTFWIIFYSSYCRACKSIWFIFWRIRTITLKSERKISFPSLVELFVCHDEELSVSRIAYCHT